MLRPSKENIYYATPEGHETVKKALFLSKYGLAAGTGMALYDISMQSKPKTILQFANVAGFWVVPAVAVGASYAIMVDVAKKLRGKEGYLNYFLAALGPSIVIRAWSKSATHSIASYFLIALGSMGVKNARGSFLQEPPSSQRLVPTQVTCNDMFIYTGERRKWEM